MIYWPGTNIPVSQGNAFTSWKTGESHVTSSKEWKQSIAAARMMAGTGRDPRKQFTIYSRARPSK